MVNILELGRELSASSGRDILSGINSTLGIQNPRQFPGSQPVTMMRSDIQRLKREDYYVCEKSDGVRALLYVRRVGEKEYSFLVDRKLRVVQVRLSLPSVGESLFDGEVVESGGIKYMIFDMMVYNGRVIVKESFLQRLNAAAHFLSLPRREVRREGISLTVKKMHKSYGLSEVYKVIIPSLAHCSDGLLFTMVNYPYLFGSSNGYLKWKPWYLNTVDFGIKRVDQSLYKLLVVNREGVDVFFDYYWSDNVMESINCIGDKRASKKHYTEQIDYDGIDGEIGEFSYIRDEYSIDPSTLSLGMGRWSLIRVRDDKNRANSLRVALNVMESIREEFGYEELEGAVGEIRRSWKERESGVNKGNVF